VPAHDGGITRSSPTSWATSSRRTTG
jgi:hypothetical protein